MKSNMCIEVEFLAGTSIEDAVTEAKSMAEKLDIAYVKFNFNGISMSISKRASAESASEAFREALAGKNGFNFVVE